MALDNGFPFPELPGLVVTLRRSKTDQEAEGRRVGLPYSSNPDSCPVQAMQRWLEASVIKSGAVFRPIDRHGHLKPQRLTAQSVALVAKRCAEACGKDPNDFAGHSLRSGHAT